MTFDFQPYLSAIAHRYSQQRDWHTPSSVFLPLNARVTQRQDRKNTSSEVDSDDRPDNPVEQLPVLEGLRKYALGNDREHVLLTGRPGSGKSTALQQLVVALAEDGHVPVLVPLKDDRLVPELIRAEFRRAKQKVTLDDIDDWLLDDRLILLLDGINEIPNEDLRRQLARFREENPTTPMIFTTRDLAVGGDLSIERRLEIQPLNPKQVQIFVGQYLPEHGEQLLRQLGDRLRELAETPLLLKLLCDVFHETGAVPKNKGELFRQFDQDYERIKQEEYVSVSENFWDFKSECLQYLAFSMIQADAEKPTEAWLTIPQNRAELILEDWLRGRGLQDAPKQAKLWLKDLRRHQLLQDATKPKEIEFHHQLFQEYYAAEHLLQQLPALLKDESRFKYDYLNYLKWTESIALMLSLTNDKERALEIVNLAMNDVDLMMGARLAGSVKSDFQDTTVGWITSRNIPLLLKCQLWASCQSEKTIPELLKTLEGETSQNIRYKASSALAALNTEQATFGLLNALHHEDYDVRWKAAEALGKSRNEKAIPELLVALQDQKSFVRRKVVEALGDIGSEQAIQELIKILKDRTQGHDVNSKAAEALSKICTDKENFLWLLEALEYERSIPGYITKALGYSDDNQIVQKLLNALDEDKSFVFWRAAYALGRIGCREAIPKLVKALENPDKYIRRGAIEGLGQIKDLKVMPELVEVLSDEDTDVRKSAISVLGQLGSEQVVPKLLEMLEDENDKVRLETICAFGKMGSMKTVPALCKSLQDSSKLCRRSAAISLGQIDSEESITDLLVALKDKDNYIRRNIANTLGQLGSRKAVPGLIKALQNERVYNYGEKRSIISALSQLDIDQVVAELIAALKDCSKTLNARLNVVEALGELGTKEIISELLNIRDAIDNEELCQRIIITLGKLGRKEVILELINIFQSGSFRSKCDAIKVLGILGRSGSETAIRALINGLEDFPDNHNTRMRLIESLGFSGGRQEFIEQEVIPVLVNSLEDKHHKVRWSAVDALGKIGHPSPLAKLWKLQLKEPADELLDLITAIQNRCQFYNYEIWQEAVRIQRQAIPSLRVSSADLLVQLDRIEQVTQATYQSTERMANEPKYNFPKAEKVNIIENADTYIETQHNYAVNPESEELKAELKNLLTQLQAQHPTVSTETEALDIIDAEFTEIQQAPSHKLTVLRQQLLNPERHLQASKATLAEVAKHYLEESVWAKAVLTYLDKMSETPDQGA